MRYLVSLILFCNVLTCGILTTVEFAPEITRSTMSAPSQSHLSLMPQIAIPAQPEWPIVPDASLSISLMSEEDYDIVRNISKHRRLQSAPELYAKDSMEELIAYDERFKFNYHFRNKSYQCHAAHSMPSLTTTVMPIPIIPVIPLSEVPPHGLHVLLTEPGMETSKLLPRLDSEQSLPMRRLLQFIERACSPPSNRDDRMLCRLAACLSCVCIAGGVYAACLYGATQADI